MPNATCVNLKRRFGDRFKVTYEESYYAQYGKNARIEDPWLMILLCQNGHIYPQGGNVLAASTNGYRAAARLARLPFARVLQDGDDGANISFPVDQFDAVAEIMRPRRRKRLSEEHRAALVARGTEALKKYRQANYKPSQIDQRTHSGVGAGV